MFNNIVVKAAGAVNVHLHTTRRMSPTRAGIDCLTAATSAMDKQCVSFSKYDYAMKLSSAFVSMCESGVSTESILGAIKAACPVKGSFVGGVF